MESKNPVQYIYCLGLGLFKIETESHKNVLCIQIEISPRKEKVLLRLYW